MQRLSVGLLSGALALSMAGPGAAAETATTRSVTMPFAECLSIISEVAKEVDRQPVDLVSTADSRVVRINADDGFVRVSCSRPDSRMVLTRSPVPEAAGMTASR